MDFTDGIKKIFLAGVGALAITNEKSKKIVDDLVKKGELTWEEGKTINAEIKKKAQVESFMRMSQEEREELRTNLAEAEKAIAEAAAKEAEEAAKAAEEACEEADEMIDEAVEAAEEAAEEAEEAVCDVVDAVTEAVEETAE